MAKLNPSLINKIAQSCINLYDKLPKTGKPVDKEWTVLSCIVQYDNTTDNIEVVSLGTGSKCIGASKMSSKGDILNDSHAEVFARRGFLLYLYDNIDKAIDNKQSIFNEEGNTFKLKENIEFIFYSSQLPCGDASIIPKSGSEDFGDVLQSYKRQAENNISDRDCEVKKLKGSDDVHRTGAKCLPHSEQDPKTPGTKYHLLGQVRTKPGRGDRTLSVSCSDKMARWVHLGIQGSLLDILLYEPIYMKYFIFGAGAPYSEESLTRALLYRHLECSTMVLPVLPDFYNCSIKFSNIRNENNTRPAPGSIVWHKTNNQLLEVAIQGKRLGVTKKKANLLGSSICISKINLYKRFCNVLNKSNTLKQSIIGKDSIENIPYNVMKRKATRYKENWSTIIKQIFITWTVKPDIWNFCVNGI